MNFTPDQIGHIRDQVYESMTFYNVRSALPDVDMKCVACRIGLKVAIGTAIVGAIAAIGASGGTITGPITAAIATISSATGISAAVINATLKDIVSQGLGHASTAVEMAIDKLCELMGACG